MLRGAQNETIIGESGCELNQPTPKHQKIERPN